MDETGLTLTSIAVVLFLIMDPIGNIGSYLKLMEGIPPRRQKWILVREMGIVFLVMLLFNYLGEYIFGVLGISETTVRLATGVILFLIAIKIIFPASDSLRAHLPKGEPFISPLAIPLVAGPSLLATVMLYAHLEPSQSMMLSAMAIATIATLGVFLLAPYLQKYLGNNGLIALERLMGMVLALLAIQRLAEGLTLFVKLHCLNP